MTSTLPDRTATPAPSATDAPSRRERPDMPRRLAEPGGILWEGVGLVTFQFTSGSAFLLQTMEPSGFQMRTP